MHGVESKRRRTNVSDSPSHQCAIRSKFRNFFPLGHRNLLYASAFPISPAGWNLWANVTGINKVTVEHHCRRMIVQRRWRRNSPFVLTNALNALIFRERDYLIAKFQNCPVRDAAQIIPLNLNDETNERTCVTPLFIRAIRTATSKVHWHKLLIYKWFSTSVIIRTWRFKSFKDIV